MKTPARPALSALAILSLALITLAADIAAANNVRSYTRIRGQGESILEGVGLVVGLPGSGDSGDELPMIRPLARRLELAGNPIANLDELSATQAVALVMVTCVVPRRGAEVDDTLEVTVSTLGSADSLAGGTLLTAPLFNAVPNGQLHAFAQGTIDIDDEESPTTGVIRGAARIVRPVITMPDISESFDLVVEDLYAGWSATSHIAQSINDGYFLTVSPSAEPIATALTDRLVRIRVPEEERAGIAAFISDIMSATVSPELLGLPAMVVCNTRTGVIVVTGDVRISPALITHKDLVIQTTLPAPQPTPEAPVIQEDRWVPIQTNATEPELARIQDLINAFDQLDVEPVDQIDILKELHTAGKLHAKLVIDGAGR